MNRTTTPAAVSAQLERRSELFWVFSNIGTLIRRSLLKVLKNPAQVIINVVSAIVFMALFRYVFGGAIETGGISYINFLVAGILVQTAAFGATTTGIGVSTDMQKGIIDRFRSLPMVSAAVLIGHVTADLARNSISIAAMIGTAFVIGFRPDATPTEWVAAIALLLIFSFAMSWFAATVGLLVKKPESVSSFTFMVLPALTFASSAYVPTNTMPAGLRIFAENQPITQMVEAVRALLVGTPLDNYGWLALTWCAGIILVAIPLTAFLFRRYTAQ